MTLWVCSGDDGCGTKYAVGLFRCPRCHNTAFFEDGDPMAKITRHGGASDKTLPAASPGAEADAVDAEEPVPVPAAEPEPAPEGGEESSPGSSSSASTEAPQTNSEPSKLPRRKPARGTASRSKPGPTESASVPSTDGEKTDGTSAADEDPE